jgi:tyrosyl-tRNA synthetase
MRSYFETLTDVEEAKLDEFDRKMREGTLNPRDVKLLMAREIVTEFHNAEAAQEAEEAFIRQFSERKLPTDIPEYRLAEPVDIVTFIENAKMAKSRNNARELIKQGGVYLYPNGENSSEERITDFDFQVPTREGAIVRVGKRQYARIV